MPAMRVHELAKEFGMSSKELLDRLQELKIPAKNHASTLVEAYVDKIRKSLGPEIAERQAAVAEENAKREAEEAAKRAAAEAARKAAEDGRRKATEEEPRRRREVSARHHPRRPQRAAGLGVEPEAIAAGLSAASLSAMRMQVFTSASGITVINDPYTETVDARSIGFGGGPGEATGLRVDGSLRGGGANDSSPDGSNSSAGSGGSTGNGGGSSASQGASLGLAVSGVELSGQSVRAEVDGQQLRAAWCLGR